MTPTDKQLNEAAARFMGCWVYHYNKDYEQNCYYLLCYPDSFDPVNWHYPHNQKQTESEAWKDAPDLMNDRESLLKFLAAVEHHSKHAAYNLVRMAIGWQTLSYHTVWYMLTHISPRELVEYGLKACNVWPDEWEN